MNNNLYFEMLNLKTRETVKYILFCDYIEVIRNEEKSYTISKNNKSDNQNIMDIINGSIKDGYILKELNLVI